MVDIVGAADQREYFAVAPGKPAPRGNELQGIVVGAGATDADRIVEAGDAAGAEHLCIGLAQWQRKRVGIEVDLQRREHVDDQRALHQVDDPG